MTPRPSSDATTTTTCFGFNGGTNGNNKRSRNTSTKFCNPFSTTTTKGNSTNYDDDDTSLLARELNDLSFQERERVYEEVHGVATLQEETPQFMKKCIEELHQEISKLSRSKRRALDRAIFLKPTLLDDSKFVTMFLRADCYNAETAAHRMGRYFTNKLILFGEDKLVKDITLEDLDDDDMECANIGSVMALQERDQAGRYVWFVAQMHYKYKHWKNQIRYTWYQVMATLEDEEAQIRGVVDVVYSIGMDGMESSFSQLLTEGAYMLNDLPFRIVGLHFCYNDRRLKPALSLIQMICSQQTRLRFRTHFGSNIEVQYELMTFGIPMNSIPMRPDGSLIQEVNQEYLQKRRTIEAQRKQQEQLQKEQIQQHQHQQQQEYYIEYPGPYDVLLGRGRPFQEYIGNQRLTKQFVDVRRLYYHSITDRFEKTCISMDVVKKVQEHGGRFLQRIPNHGWIPVDDATAREKVSHTFRTKATTSAPTTKNTTSNAKTPNAMTATNRNIKTRSKRIRYDETIFHNNNDDNHNNEDDVVGYYDELF